MRHHELEAANDDDEATTAARPRKAPKTSAPSGETAAAKKGDAAAAKKGAAAAAKKGTAAAAKKAAAAPKPSGAASPPPSGDDAASAARHALFEACAAVDLGALPARARVRRTGARGFRACSTLARARAANATMHGPVVPGGGVAASLVDSRGRANASRADEDRRPLIRESSLDVVCVVSRPKRA